jgi:hypothetical protein
MDTGRALYGGSNPPLTLIGDVAQSVEQWTENPCATGSIPVITTNGVKGLNDDLILLSEILVQRHDK